MSITVLNIMEQVSSRNTGRIVEYINAGLSEIADLIPDKTDRSLIDVESGVRLYTTPSTAKKLLGVFQKADEDLDKYARIGIIQSLDVIQDDAASTTTSDDDLIVI